MFKQNDKHSYDSDIEVQQECTVLIFLTQINYKSDTAIFFKKDNLKL